MQYLQCMSFARQERFTVFVIFCNFGLKNFFRKVKISQRRKKVATNFDIFSESSEHYLSPITSSFLPFMSKNSLEGVKVYAKS